MCDCRLKWLAEYLHHNPIETSGARCEAPKKMQRKRLASFKEDKLKCKFFCHYLFVCIMSLMKVKERKKLHEKVVDHLIKNVFDTRQAMTVKAK